MQFTFSSNLRIERVERVFLFTIFQAFLFPVSIWFCLFFNESLCLQARQSGSPGTREVQTGTARARRPRNREDLREDRDPRARVRGQKLQGSNLLRTTAKKKHFNQRVRENNVTLTTTRWCYDETGGDESCLVLYFYSYFVS